MTTEQTISILTKNISETIGLDEVRAKLDAGKNLRIYWGTAPTRVPHIAYLCPLLKLRDLIKSERCIVTIFLADLHSYLDKGFEFIPQTDARTKYYKFLISSVLSTLGVEEKEYEFVKGSDVQLQPVYSRDLLRFCTIMTVRNAQHAGSEVVKQTKDACLSSLIYPLMQCLDETALEADIQLGGCDQRKIFMLSRDYITRLGYEKCAYLMNPLIPSLSKKTGTSKKMSASDTKGKIEFTDSDEDIRNKIRGAFCVDGDLDLNTNPCLSMFKHIVFPFRDGKNVGKFSSYDELLQCWNEKLLKAQELKDLLATSLCQIVAPIRELLQKQPELYQDAYGEPRLNTQALKEVLGGEVFRGRELYSEKVIPQKKPELIPDNVFPREQPVRPEQPSHSGYFVVCSDPDGDYFKIFPTEKTIEELKQNFYGSVCNFLAGFAENYLPESIQDLEEDIHEGDLAFMSQHPDFQILKKFGYSTNGGLNTSFNLLVLTKKQD